MRRGSSARRDRLQLLASFAWLYDNAIHDLPIALSKLKIISQLNSTKHTLRNESLNFWAGTGILAPSIPRTSKTMKTNTADETMMTVIASDQTRWKIRAICFDVDFDLEEIPTLFSNAHTLYASPCILDFNGAFAAFLPFGILLYWAGDEQQFVQIMMRIEKQFSAKNLPFEGRKELEVSSKANEDTVSFREISLKHLSVQHIKVISEVFGQSAALHRCDVMVQELLSKCQPVVKELQMTGNMHLSSKELLKLVGKTLSLREELLAKLALIDSPPEIWHSERLSRLHYDLSERFNIKPRLASLQTKLEFLLDVNETLMNLIRHRESHRLEWIVISLIVIEVIYSTIHFMKP